MFARLEVVLLNLPVLVVDLWRRSRGLEALVAADDFGAFRRPDRSSEARFGSLVDEGEEEPSEVSVEAESEEASVAPRAAIESLLCDGGGESESGSESTI